MHATHWGTRSIEVIEGDITTLETDVIVNAANSSLLGGGGVDGAIHEAAGPSLLKDCQVIAERDGGCKTGDAVITAAGWLRAKHVVHAVGPIWTGDSEEEQDAQLASCYARAIDLAEEAGATSIAFPNISTGAYRFPLERAADVSIAAVRDRLKEGATLTKVVFCCFNAANYDLYTERVG